MTSRDEKAPRTRATPDVTPLVDVLLVLLVVIMVAVPHVRRAESVPAPAARTSARQLVARLRAAYGARPDEVLLVHADGTVTYQTVVAAAGDSVRNTRARR